MAQTDLGKGRATLRKIHSVYYKLLLLSISRCACEYVLRFLVKLIVKLTGFLIT